MPLTRNLYEIDEVVSALQTCLRNGWSRALFWLWELVVSEEDTLASQTLIDTWLRYGGGVDPGLLNETEWIDRCVRTMAAIQTAGSLHAGRFLVLKSSRPSMTPLPRSAAAAARRANRSAAFVASLDPSEQVGSVEAANFWISFDSACRQGSRTDALWLLQAVQPILSADAIWSALKIARRGPICHVEVLQGAATNPHPLQQLLFQAAATLHLCIPSQERAAYVPPRGTKMQRQAWTTWDAQVGRRRARLYAIPAEALHSRTTRGRISRKYTNIEDVREPVPDMSEGCIFWQKTLQSYRIETDLDTYTVVFPDDTVLETFYDTHFPDDIPDEWSKEDQMKSHGCGVQETAPPAPEDLPIRETPVSRRAWNSGIHVRPKKVEHRGRQG